MNSRTGTVGLLLLPLVLLAAACSTTPKPATPSPTAATAIAGIPCEQTERLTYHVHAHLAIFVNGQPVIIPANIGIPGGRCIYWLHTHDTTGVIHLEAPASRQFDLGTFFDIWHQPLSATGLLGYTVDAGHSLQFFVDGQPYTGDPRQISLGAHTLVTLEYGPPFVPPPAFTFPAGL